MEMNKNFVLENKQSIKLFTINSKEIETLHPNYFQLLKPLKAFEMILAKSCGYLALLALFQPFLVDSKVVIIFYNGKNR